MLCSASALAATPAPAGLDHSVSHFASPDRNQPDTPVITPAASFISEPEDARSFDLGNEPVILHSTVAAPRSRAALKQVRLFRLDTTGRDPRPHAHFGTCEVYLTSVIDIVTETGRDKTAISLNTFRDSTWLSPDAATNTVRPGRWLVVFESYEDRSIVFRIQQSSHEIYFKGGWVLTLTDKKKEHTDAAAILNRMRPSSDVLAEANKNDRSRVCHLAHSVKIAGTDSEETQLLSCAEGDELAP